MSKLNSIVSLVLLVGCLGWAGCNRPRTEAVSVAQTDVFKVRPLPLSEANDVNAPQEVNTVVPEKLDLTLEACRTMALRNNLALHASLMDPTLAAEAIGREKAKFEAVFNSSVQYDRYDNPVSSSLEGASGNDLNTHIGVNAPLSSGGTLSMNLTDGRSESDLSYLTVNPYYNTRVSFSLSQPLLRNAGARVNTHSIRIAQYQHQAADAQTRLAVTNLIHTVDGYYWVLYAYRRELEVRRQEYDFAQAQLEQAKRLVAQGQRSQVEIIRAEAGVAQRREAIIIAENNVRLQERGLKRVINRTGLGIESTTHIIPTSQPRPIQYVFDPNRLIALALKNRMEMLQLEIQLAQDKSTVDFYRNQTLPDVSLRYSFTHTGLGGSRQDAYELMTNNRFDGTNTFGVDLMIPLGNQAAKHQLQQAIYRRGQRLANRANQHQLIEEQVLNAVDQVRAVWQRIMASRHSAITSGREYEAEKHQFDLGLRTSTEVLDSQSKLADAQSSEIRALADYQIALENLAYNTGTLLGAAQVEWTPIVPGS